MHLLWSVRPNNNWCRIQECSCKLPNHPNFLFFVPLKHAHNYPPPNILFSNILCSLTKFHTHTKQTSSYARCGVITAVFVRIQVFQDATPCLVRSQSPESDVCTSGLLESNLHWIAHFRSPQQPLPPPHNFPDCSFLLPTNGFILPSFSGPCIFHFAADFGNTLILTVTTAVLARVFVT